jgi:hypothetical protein
MRKDRALPEFSHLEQAGAALSDDRLDLIIDLLPLLRVATDVRSGIPASHPYPRSRPFLRQENARKRKAEQR